MVMKKIDQNIKISVILPIYNAQDYLKECVDSVMNQTYSNLQVILVNDGSSDNSWKICQELEKIDNRIVAVTQKNRGVSVARNRGMELATGQWIMFVDPDDILNKSIIEKLLCKAHADVDIVSCCCYGFDKKEKTVNYFFKEDMDFKTDKTDLYLQLLNPGYGQPNFPLTAIGVPWGKIYRREFLKKYNLKFDPKLRRMQDNLFNMYAFYYAQDIKYLNDPLYFYRLAHINNYNKKNFEKIRHIFIPVLDARYKAINELGLNNNVRISTEYINETASIFLNITQSIVLSNRANVQQELNDLISKEYIKKLFTEKDKIRNKKIKFKLFLLKKRKYRSYQIITQLLVKLKGYN